MAGLSTHYCHTTLVSGVERTKPQPGISKRNAFGSQTHFAFGGVSIKDGVRSQRLLERELGRERERERKLARRRGLQALRQRHRLSRASKPQAPVRRGHGAGLCLHRLRHSCCHGKQRGQRPLLVHRTLPRRLANGLLHLPPWQPNPLLLPMRNRVYKCRRQLIREHQQATRWTRCDHTDTFDERYCPSF